MGHLIQKKLRSRRGISLVMAMMFMLVCGTIGSVILAMASANAGHIRTDLANEREYMAVASAANLLKADFTKMSVTCSYTGTKTTTRTGKGENVKKTVAIAYEKGIPQDVNGNFVLDDSELLNEKCYEKFLKQLDRTYIKMYAKNGWPAEDTGKKYEAFVGSGVAGMSRSKFMMEFNPVDAAGAGGREVDLPPVVANLTMYFDDATYRPLSIEAQLYAKKIPAEGETPNPNYKSYVTNMLFTPNWVHVGGPKADPPHTDGETYVEEEAIGSEDKLTWNLEKVWRGE